MDENTLMTNKKVRLLALPALVVGLSASLVFFVAVVWLPTRLCQMYEQRLESALGEYSRLGDDTGLAARKSLAAKRISIIFSRLTSLESHSAKRYWQWAEFSAQHARTLGEQLEERGAASSTVSGQSDLQSQSAYFGMEARNAYEYLAQSDSDFRDRAFLRLARDKHAVAVSSGKRPDSIHLTRLERLASKRSVAPDADLGEAKVLCVELKLESAWYYHASGNAKRVRLRYKPEVISGAAGIFTRLPLVGEESATRLKAVSNLISVFGQPDLFAQTEINPYLIGSGERGFIGWQDRLAEVVLLALAGDWNDVAYLLARRNSDNSVAVRNGLARWVCRLSVSNLARDNQQWRESYSLGLQLVSQVAPQLPEFSELLWNLASLDDSDAFGVKPKGVTIPPELVSAVVAGESSPIRHSVLALSNFSLHKDVVARSHLKLVQRSAGSLMIVGHVVLSLIDDQHISSFDLERISVALVELEPASGFNWYVHGVVTRQCKKFETSQLALEEAIHLMGEIPQIKALLEDVEKHRN